MRTYVHRMALHHTKLHNITLNYKEVRFFRVQKQGGVTYLNSKHRGEFKIFNLIIVEPYSHTVEKEFIYAVPKQTGNETTIYHYIPCTASWIHMCNTSIFTLKPCRSGLGNLTCALNSYSMHHPNQLHIASRQEMKKPCSIDPTHPVIFKKAGGKQIFAQMMWTWDSLLTVIWTTPPPAETQLDWTRSLGNNSVIGGNQSSYLNGSFKQKNVGHAACISLSLYTYIYI